MGKPMPPKMSYVCVENKPPQKSCGKYKSGQSWKVSCNTCKCNNGKTECTKKKCPPPPKKSCGKYKSGQSWKVSCNTCKCNNGKSVCTKKKCPTPTKCTKNGAPCRTNKNKAGTCRAMMTPMPMPKGRDLLSILPGKGGKIPKIPNKKPPTKPMPPKMSYVCVENKPPQKSCGKYKSGQ